MKAAAASTRREANGERAIMFVSLSQILSKISVTLHILPANPLSNERKQDAKKHRAWRSKVKTSTGQARCSQNQLQEFESTEAVNPTKNAPKQAMTRNKISLRPSLDPSSADVYILYTFPKITNCNQTVYIAHPGAIRWPLHGPWQSEFDKWLPLKTGT